MRRAVLNHLTDGLSWLGWLTVLSACADSAPPKQDSLPPTSGARPAWDTVSPGIDTTVEQLDTVLGRCDVVLQPPSAEQQEAIDALRFAYGLEATLFERDNQGTISREAVYVHYRQGFGERLAQQLTDYSWQSESQHLRATDRALTQPDSVGVLDFKQDHALVAWIAPTLFRAQWGVPRCVVDQLVRENGRWIVQAREP